MIEESIQNESTDLVVAAKSWVIDSAKAYGDAGELWNRARDLRAKIAEAFNPIIKKAHDAHKEALKQRDRYDEPLETAQKQLKSKMIVYDTEQEQIRRLEQARADKAAKERAEHEALELAETLEAAGAHDAALEVLDEPIKAPVVVVPNSTPKVDGFKYRSNWRAEVVDFDALVKAVAEGKVPLGAVSPNAVFLHTQARALKQALNYPGVKVIEEKV